MPVGMETRESRVQSEALKAEFEGAKSELGNILDQCLKKTDGGTWVVKEGAGEKLVENKIDINGHLERIKGLKEGSLEDLDSETLEFLNKMQVAVDYLQAESEI